VIRSVGCGQLLFAGIVGEAAAQTAYAAVGHPIVSTIVMFAWGMSVSAIAVPFYAILQAMIDERFVGRTFALVGQAEGVATVLAMSVAAVLIPWFDSRTILLLGGFAYGAVAVGSWLTFRQRLVAECRAPS
jgi:hypothetical protein